MKWLIILLLVVLTIGTIVLVESDRNEDGNGGGSEVLEQMTSSLLLPDMIVEAPREIQLSGSGGNRKLRFSTTFVNQGSGPLEVIKHVTSDNSTNYATQYVREQDGPGIYRDVGKFIYHPTHTHWHLERYVQYSLWTVNEIGERVEKLLQSEKMSFCIWDESAANLELKNAVPKRVYTSNCGREVQGMSVGWSDTYAADIEGQEILIENLPDGTYLFVSEVNPERKILESDYNNNSSSLYITISGGRLTRSETFK